MQWVADCTLDCQENEPLHEVTVVMFVAARFAPDEVFGCASRDEQGSQSRNNAEEARFKAALNRCLILQVK